MLIVRQLLKQNSGLLLMLDESVDTGNGLTNARLQDLFGEFFLVEDDHFFYVANATLEIFAESGDLANDDGRTGDRLKHAELTTLDALGDFHFPFAGKQGNGAHLAQVHADGVVGFFKSTGREVEFYIFALFAFCFEFLAPEFGAAFEYVDSLRPDCCDQVVEVVG